ncbi:hypothetical protein ACIQXI_15975 [Lysinibacillus sp. NPDC097195]|uniref:hypothetical protein n=1 Tax=Lysinibacillus sp. NPDC097195 TaxID=3364141 RepID=UPI003824A15D
MKLLNVMEQERQSAYYNRKKILQRKEAGDAYRKNAQYFQPKKNPILLELENLLLGRKDQDLYEQHKEEAMDVTPQQQAMMQDLQQTEKNVKAHELAVKAVSSDSSDPLFSSRLLESDNEDKDSFQLLPQVRNVALTPTMPASQDFRIAASTNAQIAADNSGAQLDNTALYELEPPYVTENIDVQVPERFLKDLNLDPFADTIFGKSYEEALKARTFKMASAKYAAHIQMAKSGYRFGEDSTFSMSA